MWVGWVGGFVIGQVWNWVRDGPQGALEGDESGEEVDGDLRCRWAGGMAILC